MKPGKYFIERALSDSINCAVNQAVKNPSGPDPFGSALKSSMDWYALTLPAALQQDRVTNKETIPSKRQVTVNSYNNQNAKPKHRLIKEVKSGKIVFDQPLLYTVKTGDTLSEIAWKHTGRRASVQDLKNWNTIFSDTIQPGQVLRLADPDDKLIKEAIAKLSKSELSSRNPSVNLDKVSRELVIKHGGLLDSEYQVRIILEYNEPWKQFLNPELVFEDAQQSRVSEGSVDNLSQVESQRLSEIGSSIRRTLEYLDSFVAGGGYGFYNSKKMGNFILIGRNPDDLFCKNIIDPFEIGIVFNKANFSFGPKKFKNISKPNYVLQFEFSLDFADGVEHVISGKENAIKTASIIRRIYKDGRWIILDTLNNAPVNIIDSLYYDKIKNLPAWKGLNLD